MRKSSWLGALTIILSTAVMAFPKVEILDNTTWALHVEPDAAAKDKGEAAFTEVLTFVAGSVYLSAPKVGARESPYTVSKIEETIWTFETKRVSTAEGGSIWTGTVLGNDVEGKLVYTDREGVVLTYTFKGYRLD